MGCNTREENAEELARDEDRSGPLLVAENWGHIGHDHIERTYRFVYNPNRGKLLRLDEIRRVGAPVEASRDEYADVQESVVQNLDMMDSWALDLTEVEQMPDWAQSPAPYTAPFTGPAL